MEQTFVLRQLLEEDGTGDDRRRDDGAPSGPRVILTVGTPAGGRHDFPIPLDELSSGEMDVRSLIEEAFSRGDDYGDARGDRASRAQVREAVRDWLAQSDSPSAGSRSDFTMLMQSPESSEFRPLQPRSPVRFREDATNDQRFSIQFARSQAGG